MRIGELLLKNGIITKEQLNEALALQGIRKKRLGEVLIDLETGLILVTGPAGNRACKTWNRQSAVWYQKANYLPGISKRKSRCTDDC